MAKCGHGDTYCSGNYHGDSFEYLARFCNLNSVAIMQYADVKPYRCVVELKMKVEFENGCCPSNGAKSMGVGSRKGAPTLSPCNLVLRLVCDPIARSFLVFFLLLFGNKVAHLFLMPIPQQHISIPSPNIATSDHHDLQV